MKKVDKIKTLTQKQEQELAKFMVKRLVNMEEHQGLDYEIFTAFESWSLLRCIDTTKYPLQGILGKTILQGNAYIIIINAGRILDNKREIKCSLKAIWKQYNQDIDINNEEKEFITKSLNNPQKCDMLNSITRLRHEAVAHNKRTLMTIDSQVVEIALHFVFRCWGLLNTLLPNHPIMFPFGNFDILKSGLDKILSQTELDLFRKTWENCEDEAKLWLKTPVGQGLCP